MKDWDLFQIPIKEKANPYDGHTPHDVAKRLREFLTPKPQYPKTYKECCKMLGYSGNYNMILTTDVDNKLFNALYRLKVCRDAWWKMADDWKPDYNDCTEDKYFSTKFFIYTYRNEIHFGSCELTHHLLAFPTAEMRDAFYDNFKELINEVKELL